MAFAVFYEVTDLQAIAAQIVRTDLSESDKTKAAAIWNNGFKDWEVSGACPYAKTEGSPFIRAVVVSSVTLQHFVDLLRSIATSFPQDPAAVYMGAIADDISAAPFGDNSAAVEPWSAGG